MVFVYIFFLWKWSYLMNLGIMTVSGYYLKGGNQINMFCKEIFANLSFSGFLGSDNGLMVREGVKTQDFYPADLFL